MTEIKTRHSSSHEVSGSNSLHPLSEQTLETALAQKQGPRLKEIGVARLLPFISACLKRMEEIEQATKESFAKKLTSDDLNSTDAIWVLSAPGTYFQAFKEDRYKDLKWTQWWDRKRLNTGSAIARLIAEHRTARKLKDEPRELWRDILMHAAPLIYNGRSDENAAVKKALQLEHVAFPQEKVFIIDDKIDNLLDQVKSFRLPNRLLQEGDKLIIVSHTGQALRLMHMLAKHKEQFPDGVNVKIIPLPTPKEGLPQYHIQETCGILYYVFSSGDAVEEPYPYLL